MALGIALRRVLAIVGVVVVSLVAIPTTSSALTAASPDTAASARCPTGYLCLFSADQPGMQHFVREGAHARFYPPLVVSMITNSTSLDYCIDMGSRSLIVGPGETWFGLEPFLIYSVWPDECLLAAT